MVGGMNLRNLVDWVYLMPEVTKEDLHRLYVVEQRSLVQLGALYGRAPGTVWGWLKSRGIPVRSCREAAKNRSNAISVEDDARIQEMYEAGASSNDIAKAIGRDGRLIRTHLSEMGIIRGRADGVRLAVERGKITAPDMRVKEDVFHTWTQESAWVLGLLFGDGHVRDDDRTGQRQISLAGTEDVCRSVARIIEHDRGPAPHNQGANCWVLKWSSWRMVRELGSRFGMGGAKATTMKFPDVPGIYLSHFLRGIWDADGGWERRGGSLRANYACSSIEFVNVLIGKLEDQGWEPRLYSHVTTLGEKEFLGYRIELLAAHSRELAQWLYQDSIPQTRCKRKYQIALQERGNRKLNAGPLPRGEN